jgi:MFS family permease
MLPPFLMFALAFGGIIVPKLNLILTLICREYIADQHEADPSSPSLPILFGDDNPQCRIPEVQARVAQFTLYGNLIGGLLSAVTSPKLGALSDRYGRTRVLSVIISGTLLGEILTILAAKYPDTFHVDWILVGYASDGLCGSFIAAMAISHSYASDCTPPNRRNVAFGYFHGCLFTGIAVGPIIAGYIIKWSGSVLSVFYIALGAHIIFILFVAFVIPESLDKERQHAAREKYRLEREAAGPASDWINQIRSFNLLEPLKILYPTGQGSSSAIRRNLVLLASIDTIMFGVAMGSMTIIIIYSNYQFGWGTFESSVFVSTVNICRVFCLLVVLPVLTRIFRGPQHNSDHHHQQQQGNFGSDKFDLYIIRAAVFIDTLGYLGYTLSRNGNLFILSGVLGAVGGIGPPTLQSSLTKHVPADRTGQLLGASGLLHALARVAGPTIFNAIYSVTVAQLPQTVFVCLTATFAIACALTGFVLPNGMFLETESCVLQKLKC